MAKKKEEESISLKTKRELLMAKIEEEKLLAEKKGEVVSIGFIDDFGDTGRENYVLTNILGVDLNINGIKKGTINVFYGAESSGKSSTALSCIEGIQMSEPDALTLYVDTEQTINSTFAERNPYLNMANVIFLKEGSMEKAFDKILEYAEEGLINYLVVDSIDAMISEKELAKSLEEATMMTKSSVLSRALPQLTKIIAEKRIACIFIQQIRQKFSTYQVTEGRSGGNAMRFYPSTVLKFTKDNASSEKVDDVFTTMCTRIKNEKSKVSRPYTTTYTYINTDPEKKISIDRFKEVIEYGIQSDLIVKGGSWLSIVDQNGVIIVAKNGKEYKVQGSERMTNLLKGDIDLYSKIKMRIYATQLPVELFIVKIDDIKKMLETENRKMKDKKIDLCKALGNERYLTEDDFTVMKFDKEEFSLEELIPAEKLAEGRFNLLSISEKKDFLQKKEKEEAKKKKESIKAVHEEMIKPNEEPNYETTEVI